MDIALVVQRIFIVNNKTRQTMLCNMHIREALVSAVPRKSTSKKVLQVQTPLLFRSSRHSHASNTLATHPQNHTFRYAKPTTHSRIYPNKHFLHSPRVTNSVPIGAVVKTSPVGTQRPLGYHRVFTFCVATTLSSPRK